MRNVYYKYLHPKEALVSDGVLNRFVTRHFFLFVVGLICLDVVARVYSDFTHCLGPHNFKTTYYIELHFMV